MDSQTRLFERDAFELLAALQDIDPNLEMHTKADRIAETLDSIYDSYDKYWPPIVDAELPGDQTKREIYPPALDGDIFCYFGVVDQLREIPLSETEHLTSPKVNIGVVVLPSGEIWARAFVGYTDVNIHDTILYADYVDEIDANDVFEASLNSTSNILAGMIDIGLSPTEAVDYFQTVVAGRTLENWADHRDVGYEAVRTSRETGREKLRVANFPQRITDKEGGSVPAVYQQTATEYRDVFDELCDLLLKGGHGADHRAVLEAVLIDLFAGGIWEHNEPFSFRQIMDALRESLYNAHKFAPIVSSCTSYGGMGEREFQSTGRELIETLEEPAVTLNDDYLEDLLNQPSTQRNR